MKLRTIFLFFCFTVFFSHSNDNHHIVVVIPSYNNERWCIRNLESIMHQSYLNWHAVMVDDCSTDNTYQTSLNFIQLQGFQNKITLLRNETNRGALYNIYSVVHQCGDQDILVTLDGDDWLFDDYVLEKINNAYQDPNVWLTYGQYVTYPNNTKGTCRDLQDHVIQNNSYREWAWVTSHLRTFRSGLFKKIKLKDLLYEENFFDVAWDVAFMLPMLEMTGGRFKFISDITYCYNLDNPLSDHNKKFLRQTHCNYTVRSRDRYTPQETYFMSYFDSMVDIFIFSENKEKLSPLLNSIKNMVTGYRNIIIVSDTLHQLEKEHSCENIVYTDCKSVPFDATTDYLLLVSDSVVVTKKVDLKEWVNILHQTQAFGYYGHLGKNSRGKPALIELKKGMYAWQFQYGSFSWKKPYSIFFSLFKKQYLIDAFKQIDPNTVLEFKTDWPELVFDLQQVGLCDEYAVVSNQI